MAGVDIDDVWQQVMEDEALASLRRDGRTLIPGRGHSPAVVFVVSRAPDATENTKGKLLAGKVGRSILSLIKDAAGIQDHWWYTTISKYHTNMALTTDQIDACVPHVRSEWVAVGMPGVIVTIGGTPLHALKPDIRGRAANIVGRPVYGGKNSVIWPMRSVSAAVADKSLRDQVEADWDNLGKWLRQGGLI